MFLVTACIRSRLLASSYSQLANGTGGTIVTDQLAQLTLIPRWSSISFRAAIAVNMQDHQRM